MRRRPHSARPRGSHDGLRVASRRFDRLHPRSRAPKGTWQAASRWIDGQLVIEWLLRCAKYNDQDAAKAWPLHPVRAAILRGVARSQRAQANIIGNGAFDPEPTTAEGYFRLAEQMFPSLHGAINNARAQDKH